MVAAMQSAVGDAFPDLARQLFGNVRLEFADAPLADRRLRSAVLGGCRVSELEAGIHSVFGDRVVQADHDPDALKLLIQTKGSSVLHQSGQTVEFGDGTPAIYDPTRTYALVNRTPVRLIMLQLPRHAFPDRILSSLATPVVPGPALAGLSRVLLATLRSSLAEARLLDPAGRERLGATLIDLVSPLFEGASAGARERETSLETLLLRCKSLINAELECCGLDVDRMAVRMGCSRRYIFRAFELQGVTPMHYVWEKRLARARRDLASAAHARHSITEIAFSLGFSSSAHFSRAFRERFSISPRDFRRAALVTS
jgi:AraC-like DNA-binding protein